MIQFSVVYNYKNRFRKNGTAPIQIRAYADGRCKYFSTGLFVFPQNWSEELHQVIDHHSNLHYNAEIRRQIANLENFAIEWMRQRGAITLDQLDNYFRYEDVKSFTAFWKYELEQDAKLMTQTKKNHKGALNYFMAFKKDVLFSELDFSLIYEFDNFLFGNNLHVNTVYTHHKQIKKYISLAIKKGFMDAKRNPYLQFKVKTKPTERTVLTQEEVQRIENLTFTQAEAYLEMIRDMFLFACFTGLRFSDLSGIKHCNIDKDKEGYLLNIVAKKTSKKLSLPLYKLHNKKPEEIIKKYELKKAKGDDLLFHNYTNQYYNRCLKEIATAAKIDKEVSSHAARHTFATNLASKVPIHILKSILQHSKIETTMIYLHLSNKIVNDALDGVVW